MIKELSKEERVGVIESLREVSKKYIENSNSFYSSQYPEFQEAVCNVFFEHTTIALDVNQVGELTERPMFIDDDGYPNITMRLIINEIDLILDVNATHHEGWDFYLESVADTTEYSLEEIRKDLIDTLHGINSKGLTNTNTVHLRKIFNTLDCDSGDINNFLSILEKHTYYLDKPAERVYHNPQNTSYRPGMTSMAFAEEHWDILCSHAPDVQLTGLFFVGLKYELGPESKWVNGFVWRSDCTECSGGAGFVANKNMDLSDKKLTKAWEYLMFIKKSKELV